MSSLIDTAVAHFQNIPQRELHIEEWGEEGTTLYCTPLTLAERKKCLANAGEGNIAEFMVYAIIEKVTDENGTPLFTKKDKVKLMNFVSPSILSRIGEWVLETESEEELEKN
jgi:hypothetical protein